MKKISRYLFCFAFLLAIPFNCQAADTTEPNSDAAKMDAVLTAIHAADFSRIEHILKDIKDVDKEFERGGTLLYETVFWNREDIAKYLITRGADVNKQITPSGDTALHAAAERGHLSLAFMLASYGADPGIQNKEGLNSIQVSILNGNVDIAEILADSDAKKDIFYAAGTGNIELMEKIIASGADINAVDSTGRTPACWAMEGERWRMLGYLKKKNAKVGLNLYGVRTYPNPWRSDMNSPKRISAQKMCAAGPVVIELAVYDIRGKLIQNLSEKSLVFLADLSTASKEEWMSKYNEARENDAITLARFEREKLQRLGAGVYEYIFKATDSFGNSVVSEKHKFSIVK